VTRSQEIGLAFGFFRWHLLMYPGQPSNQWRMDFWLGHQEQRHVPDLDWHSGTAVRS
jgi:hypothetical protein